MKVAIIGSGITGLTAAYRLSQKGHQVTVFEKENYAGGFAAGFKEKGWDWHLENFFHHLFTSDYAAKNLIADLGLANRLFYTRPKTSIFKNGQTAQFDSPFSVLTFPHLSFLTKLRAGLVTTYLKLTQNFRKFENITARDWLKKHYGEKPYQILWQPLLSAKFGKEAENISMSWFWARIKKRSSKLGYIEGGFQALLEKLVEKIKENRGEIYLNREIRRFNDLNHESKFDRIIFTVSTSTFSKIVPGLSREYQVKLQNLEMLGALNLILILKKKFLTDGTYWLNINESGFPFVAVVEHTNFVDSKYYGGNRLVYVGGYYPQNHRYFKMTKKQIFEEFLPFLKRINPDFDFSLFTIHYSLFTNLYAQPIIPLNYSKLIPSFKTPIPKIFLANMQMVYPWDRGMNYAIELGEKIAKIVAK